VIRRVTLIVLALAVVALFGGCGEATQKEAQDSQEQIKKEMKASGDDKNAY
jgi:uncharacterized protein YceK